MFSEYSRDMINNSQLRGQAFTPSPAVYVQLHTSAPGVSGSAGVVDTADWPAYARKDSANGGALSSAWTASVNGISQNTQELAWAVHDGAANVTITHWSLWTALSGGQCLDVGQFSTPRTIEPEQVYIVQAGKIQRQLT